MSKTEYFLLFYLKWPLAMLLLLCVGGLRPAGDMHVRTQIDRTLVVSEEDGIKKKAGKLSGLTEQGDSGYKAVKKSNDSGIGVILRANLDSIQETERDGWRERGTKSRPMAVVNFHMNGRFFKHISRKGQLSQAWATSRGPELSRAPACWRGHAHTLEDTHARAHTHTHTHTHSVCP